MVSACTGMLMRSVYGETVVPARWLKYCGYYF
jgi:hypothetical protein